MFSLHSQEVYKSYNSWTSQVTSWKHLPPNFTLLPPILDPHPNTIWTTPPPLGTTHIKTNLTLQNPLDLAESTCKTIILKTFYKLYITHLSHLTKGLGQATPLFLEFQNTSQNPHNTHKRSLTHHFHHILLPNIPPTQRNMLPIPTPPIHHTPKYLLYTCPRKFP